MRIEYFVRTHSLMQWTKSEADDFIKLQGIKSKTVILDNYAEDEETGEFAVPSVAVVLQEDNIGNIITDFI